MQTINLLFICYSELGSGDLKVIYDSLGWEFIIIIIITITPKGSIWVEILSPQKPMADRIGAVPEEHTSGLCAFCKGVQRQKSVWTF